MQIGDLPLQLLSFADDRGAEAIVLDGQVCSGKTTTATELESELVRRGRTIDRFNIDWFIIDRARRTYRTDPTFLEMARWTDEKAAQQHLRSFLAGEELSFQAYDRVTGQRSLPVTLKRTPCSLLVLESIYALRVAHAAGMGKMRLLPCLFVATEDATYQRLLRRRTYLDRDQVEFEVKEIFFPSVRRYEKELHLQKLPFVRIDVSDFSNIKIGEVSQ